MALQHIQTVNVTSAVASVFLTGIDDDSVYKVILNNVSNASGSHQLRMRVANGSTQDSAANYDYGYKLIRSDTTFSNGAVPNASFFAATTTSTNVYSVQNQVLYLYNWYSTSEYSMWTCEEVALDSGGRNIGLIGGGVFDQAERHDSIRFYIGQSVSSEYNMTQGKFSLYKVT